MKYTRHLKYALGEIILIVIGILLAVTINEQISKSKERKRERQLMINIEEELMANIDQLKVAIASHEEGSRAGTEFLSTLRTDMENPDFNELDTIMFLIN